MDHCARRRMPHVRTVHTGRHVRKDVRGAQGAVLVRESVHPLHADRMRAGHVDGRTRNHPVVGPHGCFGQITMEANLGNSEGERTGAAAAFPTTHTFVWRMVTRKK